MLHFGFRSFSQSGHVDDFLFLLHQWWVELWVSLIRCRPWLSSMTNSWGCYRPDTFLLAQLLHLEFWEGQGRENYKFFFFFLTVLNSIIKSGSHSDHWFPETRTSWDFGVLLVREKRMSTKRPISSLFALGWHILSSCPCVRQSQTTWVGDSFIGEPRLHSWSFPAVGTQCNRNENRGPWGHCFLSLRWGCCPSPFLLFDLGSIVPWSFMPRNDQVWFGRAWGASWFMIFLCCVDPWIVNVEFPYLVNCSLLQTGLMCVRRVGLAVMLHLTTPPSSLADCWSLHPDTESTPHKDRTWRTQAFPSRWQGALPKALWAGVMLQSLIGSFLLLWEDHLTC